jgi:hypothetical protein
VSEWRRPVKVRRAGDGRYAGRGEVLDDFILEGEHAKEDLARILHGKVCIKCWQPYPDRLDSSSARAILNELRPWPRTDPEVLELLNQGRCGMCGTEVSPEMAAFFFKGEHKEREVAPGVVASGDARTGELVTEGGLVLPGGVG